VIVDERFHGYPGVAHGGYVAGSLAERFDEAVEVRFLAPVPVRVELDLRPEGDALVLSDGLSEMAVARGANLDVALPPVPSIDEAASAALGYRALSPRPSPTCMTCGIDRAPGEGLLVELGPVGDLAAGAWSAHPSFAGPDGNLHSRFVWAALDCPSYWGLRFAVGEVGRLVTARLAASLVRPVPVGEAVIVVGWKIADRGKAFMLAGSGIFSSDGEPLAVARSTWMRP
jgi:acyl-coenzyme A thioesterase PaaI-like protein